MECNEGMRGNKRIECNGKEKKQNAIKELNGMEWCATENSMREMQ